MPMHRVAGYHRCDFQNGSADRVHGEIDGVGSSNKPKKTCKKSEKNYEFQWNLPKIMRFFTHFI